MLATDGAHGVVKINGELVALTPSQAGNAASGGVLTADDLRLTVQPLPGEDAGEVNLRFEVSGGSGLRVDYRDFYRCTGSAVG